MDAGAYRNGKPLHFLSRKTRQRDFCGSPFACVSDEGSPTPFPLPKKICLGKDFLERGGIGVKSAVFAQGADTRHMRHIPTKPCAKATKYSADGCFLKNKKCGKGNFYALPALSVPVF